MRKRQIAIVLTLIFLFSLSPLFAQQYQEIDEDVSQAFGLSFQVYFFSALMSAFGQTIPGCTIEDNAMVLKNIDLATLDLSEPGTYRTMSGTITTTERADGETDMKADLTLTGGPVKNLKWEVKNFSMESPEGFFDITADGRNFRFNFSDFEEN
jgi:hypothetical protein